MKKSQYAQDINPVATEVEDDAGNSASVTFLTVFIAVYLVYHTSLYPSIAGGDSGELLAEACLHGVPRKLIFTLLLQIFHKALSYLFLLKCFRSTWLSDIYNIISVDNTI